MKFTWISRTLALALLASALVAVPSLGGDAAQAAPQKEFYVAPTGNDTTGDGTLGSPFATVDRARTAVRAYVQSHTLTDDVVVYLRGGTYELSAPVTFEPEDSGKDGHRVVYRNMPGEDPILSGGTTVTGWTLGDGGRYYASVGTGVDFRQIYVDEQRGIRAREPEIGAYYTMATEKQADGFDIPAAQFAGVPTTGTNVEVSVLVAWMHKRLRISEVTGTGSVVRAHIEAPEWNAVLTGPQATRAYVNTKYWLENAYAYLDTPGEWYLDRALGRLYYMPRPGQDMNSVTVTIPRAESLIVLDGSFADPVSDLRFEGLDFRHTNWIRPNQYGFVDVQANSLVPVTSVTDTQYRHNQAKDRVPGAIHATTADDIQIVGNDFTNLGGTGVLFTMGGNDNLIEGNAFSDIAGGGIELGNDAAWPDDPRMWPRRNTVSNNYVTRIGADYYGSVGIMGYYHDSLTIEHNEIVDVPYSGISVGWGWGVEGPAPGRNACGAETQDNIIRDNLVSDNMQRVVDGGGIYTLCDQPGTEITGNYVRSQLNNYGSIYLDGNSSYITVAGNVVSATPNWLFVQACCSSQYSTDNVVQDNFTDRATIPATVHPSNTLSNNTLVTGGAWPVAAQAIMAGAGLEAPYRGLRYGTAYGPVPAQDVVIVDNIDDGFAVTGGAWAASSSGLPGKYGSDYRWSSSSQAGWPAPTARWTPRLTTAGDYDVSVWYPGNSSRCSACAYTVTHAGGTSTVTVDQRVSGGQWVSLGRFPFLAGAAGGVEVSAQGTGTYLDADAARFTRVPSVVVDNTDAGFSVVSGTWHTSNGLAGKFGTDYRYANTSPTGTAVARWTPTLPAAGSYDVSVWYPTNGDRCTTCTYTVRSGSTTFTATANQTTSGGHWVRLGSYHFDPASTVSVEVSNQADGVYVQADAVKFEPSDAIIVDNTDAGFSAVSGSWLTSNGLAGKYGADYRYTNTSPTGTALARWSPALPAAGSYEVSVWYPTAANRCTTCTYTVRSGTTSSTAVADQTTSGGRWVLLGTYALDPAAGVSLELGNAANGTYVQADAVKFDPQ